MTFKQASKENIRLCVGLRLPFRLRVGNFFRISSTWNSIPFEIACRNTIPIPQGSRPLEDPAFWANLPRGPSHYTLWTDVLVIIERPRISRDYVASIQAVPHADHEVAASIPPSPCFDLALMMLNQFLVAYSRTASEYYGGAPLTMLTFNELMVRYHNDVVVLVSKGETLASHNVISLFDYPHPVVTTESRSPLIGSLDDLEPAQLEGIAEAITLQERFIHYEYMFRSVSAYAAGDYENGMLSAVIALEGAFTAFVRIALGERMHTSGFSEAKTREYINEFLKGAGLSTLMPVIPFLLMEEDERPTVQEIEQCKKGVAIRNQIMHVLLDPKTRAPRIRKHDWEAMQSARSDVETVYQKYVAVLEGRLTVPSR